MRCPYCGFSESKVIDSRPTEDNERIRRRRECVECGSRFTTYEAIECLPIVVVKKDRSRETFNRCKLLNGLLKACEKRPIPLSKIQALVDEIESKLRSTFEKEVPTSIIGEYVMEFLRDIDKVAYVRFASVYREFDDVDNFMDELKQLLRDKNN